MLGAPERERDQRREARQNQGDIDMNDGHRFTFAEPGQSKITAEVVGRFITACRLATAPGAEFDLEEVFVAGDRAVIRWRYRWGQDESQSVRGVNVMRVRDGVIVEALGYSKVRSPTTGGNHVWPRSPVGRPCATMV
jgi:hypothetical protein